MRKTRIVAFGIALASVILLTTPAFARDVTKFKDKDAIAFVTNCKFDHAGERCLVFGIFAEVSNDPFFGRLARLELDKYRITVVDTAGSVDVNFVGAFVSPKVTLNIADDLSLATGKGTLASIGGSQVKVSFRVRA